MRVVFWAMLLLFAAPLMAAEYNGFELAPDHSTLVLHSATGDVRAPRVGDQQGFDAPRLSPDGRMAGWLALERACCESYPLPTSLVLFRNGRIVRRFGDGLVISSWAFADGGNAVAYSQGTAHSATSTLYVLRRVADGRLLAKFACKLNAGAPPARPMQSGGRGKMPAWVWPIAEDCPIR